MCGIFGEKQIVWFGGGIGKKVGDKARNIGRGPLLRTSNARVRSLYLILQVVGSY